MIEPAKFTYSLLREAFEKQIKTIEDQREKQIKAIQNQGQVKTIKKYTYDDEDSPLISSFIKLDEKVNLNNLIYRYKGKTPDENFDAHDNALVLIDKIKNGSIKLADVKNDQVKFKSNLSEIKRGPKKSKEQKNALYIDTLYALYIEIIYKARNEAIKLYGDYSLMVSEAKNKAKNKTSGKGLKILTPK